MADAPADHPAPSAGDPHKGEKKEEKKPPTALQSFASETSDVVKKIANTATGLATHGLSYLVPTKLLGGGGLENMITSSSQVVGKRVTSEKYTSEDFRNNSIYGAYQGTLANASLLGAYSAGLANMANSVNAFGSSVALGYGVGAGLALAAVPVVTALAFPVAHFLNNKYSLKDLGKNFKEKYGKAVSDTMGTYGITTAAGVVGALAAPAFWPIWLAGSAAAGNIMYRIKTSEHFYPGKIFAPVSYTVEETTGAVRKLNSVSENIGSTLTKIYTSIGDLLAPSGTSKPATPAPAAAPAAAH